MHFDAYAALILAALVFFIAWIFIHKLDRAKIEKKTKGNTLSVDLTMRK